MNETYRIIFNINGVQSCAFIQETGGIASDAEIIWDERVDGILDESLVPYIGALVKIEDGVAVDLEKYDELQQQAQVEEQAAVDRETEMNTAMAAFDAIDSSNVSSDVKQLIKGLAYKLGVI